MLFNLNKNHLKKKTFFETLAKKGDVPIHEKKNDIVCTDYIYFNQLTFILNVTSLFQLTVIKGYKLVYIKTTY